MLTVARPSFQASKRDLAQPSITLRCQLEDCTSEERQFIESFFSETLTGLGWWQSISQCFVGNEFKTVFGFIRSTNNEIGAVVCGLYFPNIQVLKMLSKPDSGASSVAVHSLLNSIKAKCILVNGLSACSSIALQQKCGISFREALNAFVKEFSCQQPVDGVLVRCLDADAVSQIKQSPDRSSMPWQVINGYALNQIDFTGCSSIEDFIQHRLPTARRTKIRASIKKLHRAKGYSIVRLSDIDTVKHYANQMHELYRESYERNESSITFPITPSASYYVTLFREFGEARCYYYALLNDRGELIAFNIALRESTSARGIAIGLKDPDCRQVDAWYNIMLALFDDLIKDGITFLNMGNTHDELKKRIGATQTTQYAAAYLPNRLYRLVLNRFVLPKLEVI